VLFWCSKLRTDVRTKSTRTINSRIIMI